MPSFFSRVVGDELLIPGRGDRERIELGLAACSGKVSTAVASAGFEVGMVGEKQSGL